MMAVLVVPASCNISGEGLTPLAMFDIIGASLMPVLLTNNPKNAKTSRLWKT
jgi:hypothetical protein